MKKISAFILAGGQSSRMGSDKGMLPFNESVFIKHIENALRKAGFKSVTIVSGNSAYDFLDCRRIEDIYSDKGPVGGIFTALKETTTQQNIILSVDIPMISSEVINWLVASIDEKKLITQVRVLDKTSPLIGVYNKAAMSTFEEHIQNHQLKLRDVIEALPYQTIDVPQEWCGQLKNINTKEDYQNLLNDSKNQLF